MAKVKAAAADGAQEPAAEWVDTGLLTMWVKNPRKNDENVARVVESIKRFGFGAPIVARRENGEVIAGHTRLKAAIRLKLARVPVRYLDITEREAHLLALADNRLNELSPWDVDGLREVMTDFSLSDIELAGWSGGDIEAMGGLDLADLEPSGEVAEDEIPELPKVAITKPGDVWELGDHVLVCGDCRNAETVGALMGGKKIAVAFTSPPYAAQRAYDESSGFQPIHPDKFVEWFEAVQANVCANLAADGSWFVNIKEHCDEGQRHLYVKDLTIAHVRSWGWRFVDELCWERVGLPGRYQGRFKNAWEPVFHYARSSSSEIKFNPKDVGHQSDSIVVYNKETNLNPVGSLTGIPVNRQESQGKAANREMREGIALPSNRLPTFAAPDSTAHSAAFPVGLPSFFVKAFSDAGDSIFDPFMGSGTTIIACENEERRGFGTEISPGYCDVIVERWENLTGGKARRRNGKNEGDAQRDRREDSPQSESKVADGKRDARRKARG